MPDAYFLDNDDANRLKRMVQSYELGRLNQGYEGSPRPLPGPVECWVGKTTTSISAISGSTPGSGSVELYSLSSGSLVDQSLSITVYNIGSTIADGKYVLLQRDPISGSFFVKGRCC